MYSFKNSDRVSTYQSISLGDNEIFNLQSNSYKKDNNCDLLFLTKEISRSKKGNFRLMSSKSP